MVIKQTSTGQKKKSPRISLKVKWAVTVGVGIFVTFVTFSMILYGAMRQILLNQERRTVTDTLSTVVQRLSPVSGDLTIAQVVPRLEGTTASDQPSLPAPSESRERIFSDSVIQKLAQADVSVSVFSRDRTNIFQSRDTPITLGKVHGTEVQESHIGDFNGLVGTAPIYSATTSDLIGYVQVTNKLTAFHATMHEITLLIVGLSFAAVLISILIGYILATRFLKPIKLITNAIDVVNEEPESTVRIPALKRNDELGDLVLEFNGMLDRIQRYIDQQSEFVQDVSHELRTPVAILEGHLQLLNRWGKDDPEVLDESLKASLQEITRMKSLIQEMLDLTRADQVDVQFPNAVVDVHKTVQQVVADFRMIHPDFTFTLDDDLEKTTYVRMYRNHLEQVMIILMDNAVKYSTNRKEIHVSMAQNSGNGVALAVQDFGEGIAEKDRRRVFNRFYRVDKARSREKGGNGLGLSIAQQLIESYHGQIEVDSALGHGSIFRIDLPTITEAKAKALKAQEEAKQAAAPKGDTTIKSNL
ncbi:HAMP domain-containing histidine kinase [Lacticaseibacillus casei]|jgi:signal transduction histidine kinase|uniref:Signal transduction histidine-protein kinase ArlS n=1 Tax=Lacticaseibacillus huelsenbergensis TaxID=3035291 RepID=A0ABY8DQ99_9LACO|nr:MULTISPECIES: HAMP domain-containing histidine kinase [Lacticaseibacillus]MDG3060580.1 HAMP domain-containing histidine kinase [Lacticaseibacillus sp. BCRC 81376]QVI37600.1 HAMP domain-containing protein [Lacticaseibacillus casei]QXG59387.1 HAMP domain-containing histidine kinase [Lacticaseibacillus casei]WFB39154.1 HAMP domain-containing histidine kinase [Lacticaseibacillus huelsenbergensis]WFB40856.1 HAMP domain-containing histidine kinase [Lacticaseibacillus huelsenbergensis]